jgi:hypothetical protein
VRDDDDSGLAEHVVNVARRHQAPPPPQQAPAEKAGIARVGHFHGNVPGEMWLCAAWSPDGSQLVYGEDPGGPRRAARLGRRVGSP